MVGRGRGRVGSQDPQELRRAHRSHASGGLDAIDADAQGAALSRVLIEQRTRRGVPIVRYHLPDSYKGLPDAARKAVIDDFLRSQVQPHLGRLDQRQRHDTGMDFARSGDGSVLIVREMAGRT